MSAKIASLTYILTEDVAAIFCIFLSFHCNINSFISKYITVCIRIILSLLQQGDSEDQSQSREAANRPFNQKILCLLWNLQIYYLFL
jgi:hypothetical protein